MNRDELLTKLAMELAEWPKSDREDLPEGFSHSSHFVGTVESDLGGYVFIRQDWLQRRAELINKPSWDDAPEWARWLSQDADGAWGWFKSEPGYREGVWYSAGATEECDGECPQGHDWRETLERRPMFQAFRTESRMDITTSLGATEFDEVRSDILGQNGNDGLHYMTEGEQELPSEERHDCDRCGGSWWSPHNTECPCQASRSDGSTASYYELPEGATELQDLISYRNLNAQDGEIFRAVYRKGRASHSDALRDAKKVLFYAKAEVDRLERYGQ